MNTRLQVEHPVTEMVTGVDLVAVADPHRPRRAPDRRSRRRAADAARPRHRVPRLRRGSRRALPAVARDASRTCASRPAPGIRDDSGVDAGFEVPIHYDSLISKLVAWGGDRDAGASPGCGARSTSTRCAASGPRCRSSAGCSTQDDFAAARFDTTTLDAELASRQGRPFVETPRRRAAHRDHRDRARGPRPCRAAGRRRARGRAGQPVGRGGAPRGAAMSASRIEVVAGGRVHTVHDRARRRTDARPRPRRRRRRRRDRRGRGRIAQRRDDVVAPRPRHRHRLDRGR